MWNAHFLDIKVKGQAHWHTTKQAPWPQIICSDNHKIVIIVITEKWRFKLLQPDAYLTVKGQTNRGRQIDKKIGTGKEAHDTFNNFMDTNKVA